MLVDTRMSKDYELRSWLGRVTQLNPISCLSGTRDTDRCRGWALGSLEEQSGRDFHEVQETIIALHFNVHSSMALNFRLVLV